QSDQPAHDLPNLFSLAPGEKAVAHIKGARSNTIRSVLPVPLNEGKLLQRREYAHGGRLIQSHFRLRSLKRKGFDARPSSRSSLSPFESDVRTRCSFWF